MAHYQQLEFINILSNSFPSFFSNKKVVEIGSWDTNGSVRQYFNNCEYIGVDVSEGPGVDLVTKGEDISLPSGSFDVTISCECFEHNPEWQATIKNMIRLLKPGGLCIITCATTGRSEHGTRRTNPNASLTALVSSENSDYYKNLKPTDFKMAINFDDHFKYHHFFINVYSRDLYFFGVKKETGMNTVDFDSKELFQKIKTIRKNKPVKILSRLRYHALYYYRNLQVVFLGEEKYHNLRFKRLNRSLKN